MQAHAANELDIEMTHAKDTAGTFTYNRESLRQDILECLTIGKAFAECIRIARQLIISQALHLWLQCIDFLNHFTIAGNLFIVIVT